MFTQLLLEKIFQEQMLRSLGCRVFRDGPGWKELQVCKTGRERSQTVMRAWERLGRPHGELWVEYTSLSQVSHGGVRPLNLSVIHYLIWDSLERMSFWEGWLLLLEEQEGSWWYISLQLPEPLRVHLPSSDVNKITCQDILLIKWIILHKVLCTGVGSQGKLLMYTTWGWWYWWQGLEFLNWQESWIHQIQYFAVLCMYQNNLEVLWKLRFSLQGFWLNRSWMNLHFWLVPKWYWCG